MYLFWVGMAASGLGVVGFFLSFWQVGSPAQAAIDVHEIVPVWAYVSIALWVSGLLVMWYSRRVIDAAVAAKLREKREAVTVDLDARVADAPFADTPGPRYVAAVPSAAPEMTADAPGGRDA
jgi:hypothetical protein